MTPKKRIDGVNTIGIVSKAGKYNGSTYAYKDIALQFASWILLNIYCSPCSNLLDTHYLKFEQTCRFRIFFTLTQKNKPRWDRGFILSWWPKPGSNRRHKDFQSFATTIWATGPRVLGGPYEIRTRDLLRDRETCWTATPMVQAAWNIIHIHDIFCKSYS